MTQGNKKKKAWVAQVPQYENATKRTENIMLETTAISLKVVDFKTRVPQPFGDRFQGGFNVCDQASKIFVNLDNKVVICKICQ